jgi:murein DD-endopeptidase MepM/ murein hydrolase activator NlpD
VSNIEAVKSISYGVVLAVGKNNKLSNYIVIESGSKTIIYAMLEEAFVSKGDEIKLGEIIGKLNNENKLLHIEIWEDGTSIDPSKLFRISE